MTGKCLARCLSVSALVLSLIMSSPSAWSATRADAPPPIAQTDNGAVRGTRVNGVESFLGIPYAAPPTGQLRWRPPQAAPRWTGVRPATRYGNRCPALPSSNGPRSDTEDCLVLNVQRPAGTSAGRGLPVYVFVHGGGLVNGSSNQADGSKIVRETNAIVVSMNYRLGVFGFLGLPALESTRGNGNYGFLDQRAALGWLQRNIAAFGGSPRRVTLGGESAGGWSVCGHLTAPGSRGLFARAMMQSGSCHSRPRAQTEAAGLAYATSVGCAEGTLRCLRAKPEAVLLDASASFQPFLTSGTSVLPTAPQDAVDSGQFARVPVVNGANRDEGRTFTQGLIGATRRQYTQLVRSTFGDNADAVLRRYPWPATSDRFTAAYLAGAILTDSGLVVGIGGCGTLRLTDTFATYTRTYAYEFDARQGPGLTPIPGYVWGAGHAAELAYLFPSFDNGTPIAPTFDAAERQLARNMVQYWGGFVFHGSPNFHGQAHWPRYDTTSRIMSLRVGGRSQTIAKATYRREHKCDFWDSLGSLGL
jgi:carboxylesterase type B